MTVIKLIYTLEVVSSYGRRIELVSYHEEKIEEYLRDKGYWFEKSSGRWVNKRNGESTTEYEINKIQQL